MKLDVKEIKPKNENVLVSVIFQDEIDADGNYVGIERKPDMMDIEFYHARVESFGGLADSDTQCPGLEVGDHVIFNMFSGHTINTENKYSKVIRGYDIVAKVKDLKMEKDSIKPTGDRILVELETENLTDNEGYATGVEKNPIESITQRGIVISVGPSVVEGKFKKGDIVYFDPYCGNLIVNNSKMQLKTINSFDVLFTI